MAIGMVAVIITGGIDLSVGSIMGLVGVVCGILLQAQLRLVRGARRAGLLTGMAAGAINGLLIAYVGLSPFVVTLGMLSFARSLRDRPVAEQDDLRVRSLRRRRSRPSAAASLLGLSNPVWVLIFLAIVFGVDPETHDLGPPPLCDRRQRAGRAADRRAGRPGQDAGLHHLGLDGGDLRHPHRRLAGLGDQRRSAPATSSASSPRP